MKLDDPFQEIATMHFKATNLDKKDWFGKSDPFLVFHRANEDGRWVNCASVWIFSFVLYTILIATHGKFIIIIIIKNFDRRSFPWSPWLKALQTGATCILMVAVCPWQDSLSDSHLTNQF